MADDAARIAQLEADNAALRADKAGLGAEVQSLCLSLTGVLERQTATAEVLRVIATSPGNLQNTLTAVMQSAMRLCPATSVGIWQVDGDEIEMIAQVVTVDPAVRVGTRLPITLNSASGRAVHVPVPMITCTRRETACAVLAFR
jgi:hypothetical protein